MLLYCPRWVLGSEFAPWGLEEADERPRDVEGVVCLMAVCRVRSMSLFGIDAVPVEVEVDVGAGLPGFSIVGLPDAAVQEARERVRVAISNSGFKFPAKKVIVNLAPLSTPISCISRGVLLRFRGVRGVLPWCTAPNPYRV